MAKFNGKNLTIEILGESHASEISLLVLGLPKIKVDFEKLNSFMDRRKASLSAFSTPRIEADIPEFSGLKKGITTKKVKAVIKNTNVKSKDYDDLIGKPRPSHADYVRYLKDGELSFAGGGRFSARLTAPLCVAGGIAKQYLEEKGIFIEAYLSAVGEVNGLSYDEREVDRKELVSLREGFPSLDKKEEMIHEIEEARSVGDSIGGTIECIVYGMPVGVGDNLFEGLEGKISNLIYSVPAVKGVEFGKGAKIAKMRGSSANDQLYYDDGVIKQKTNNNGGINGGISNGFNLTMRAFLKPTPSISIEQDTVDLVNKENVKIKIKGRHDSCVAVRAVPCIESAVAIALLDEILEIK